jgi:hypothetical protein
VQIRKSDDLDNACAKNRLLDVLLAQADAMQIIATVAFSRVVERQRNNVGCNSQ